MKIIRQANSMRINCLGKQKFEDENEYRPLVYTTRVEVDDGLLIYNNLTDELVLLSSDEKKSIEKADYSNATYRELVKSWYFCTKDYNDSEICRQLDTFMTLLTENVQGSAITNYTIFPTTDCNARCFYCYEKNIKKYDMTEQTAVDVAKFIIKKSKGKKVRLHWFGGEPLYNSKVIDIITTILSDNSVEFISSMISNGYLFDEELIEKAVSLWKLKRVQITLDGTEDKYNSIKNYIYPDVNAFQRVISNIENLLKAGVLVPIRMNMDNHNYENLFELVDFMLEKFSGYDNFSMYSQMLFDESTEKHLVRKESERNTVFVNNQILNSRIKENKLQENKTLKGYLRNHQCMADKPSATTITPNGDLGKCEHFSDKYFWGNIYSDNVNEGNILRFKKRVSPTERCLVCPVMPACLHHLEICPDMPKCNEILQKSHFDLLETRILNTYKEWKRLMFEEGK